MPNLADVGVQIGGRREVEAHSLVRGGSGTARRRAEHPELAYEQGGPDVSSKSASGGDDTNFSFQRRPPRRNRRTPGQGAPHLANGWEIRCGLLLSSSIMILCTCTHSYNYAILARVLKGYWSENKLASSLETKIDYHWTSCIVHLPVDSPPSSA